MVTVPQTCTLFDVQQGAGADSTERVLSVSSSCFFSHSVSLHHKDIVTSATSPGAELKDQQQYKPKQEQPTCNQTQLMCSVTYTTNTGKILCSIHRLPIFHKNMRSTAGYSLQVKQKAAFLKIRFKKG